MMLKISKLKSGYQNKEILHGIDLDVNDREIVALVGPNGSGKSTVLKSVFKQANIFSGSIVFNGKNITKQPTNTLVAEGISFVPQGRLMFSNMTVEENLQMGLFVFKGPHKKRIESIYHKFKILGKKRNDLASSLSGGQQQILAIARALIQKPKLLLLDEPSLGLAPIAMQNIFNEIKKINSLGVAILIVEQNAKQATKIADRTYVLENGKIILSGNNRDFPQSKLKDLYFGGR